MSEIENQLMSSGERIASFTDRKPTHSAYVVSMKDGVERELCIGKGWTLDDGTTVLYHIPAYPMHGWIVTRPEPD